jgi:hypothetical protein
MTIRLDRLMEIAVVGYIAIAVTQVLVDGGSTALPAWVSAVTRVIGG